MKLTTGRSGILGIVLIAVGIGVASCGDDATTPNRAPRISFVQRPADGATVTDRVTFRWTASDPDGEVSGFETSLDSETEFEAFDDSTAVITFTKADGSDSNPQPHVFRVRALDDRGLASETAVASFLVAVFNDPPTVRFTSTPPLEGYIGPVARIAWTGGDGDGAIDHYEFVLDDTAAAWTSTPDTTVTIDFSSGQPEFKPGHGGGYRPLNRPVEVTFFLRGVDDEGKPSDVIQTVFLAGPENVAPTVRLNSSPPEPPAVVADEATWTWTTEDSDGEILRVQYALDLVEDTDWTRWDAATLTVPFTRSDGTAEDPTLHTFFLRAQDDDSTFSAVVTRDFLVGVPNQAPAVSFINPPDPESAVSFRFTYQWRGTDDEGIAHYLYAVDDTASGWQQTSATSAQIVFSASEVDQGTCSAAGCNAFGHHEFFVKAVDVSGLESAPAISAIQVFTRTPHSTISEPSGTGGEVTGSESLTVRWTTVDVTGFGLGVTHESLVREVADFADFPDPQAAVTETGLPWTAIPGVNGTETVLALEAGKLYIVAIRATNAAMAPESFFDYGKNVLRVTVP